MLVSKPLVLLHYLKIVGKDVRIVGQFQMLFLSEIGNNNRV